MHDDRSCQEYIALLREENEYLRQAARSFGELAERLAQELRDRRRRGAHASAPARKQAELPMMGR